MARPPILMERLKVRGKKNRHPESKDLFFDNKILVMCRFIGLQRCLLRQRVVSPSFKIA